MVAKHSPFAPPPAEPPTKQTKAWMVVILVAMIVVAVALSLFALAHNRK